MADIFKMPCNFRVPEENPALAGLLAIMRRLSLPSCGGGICYCSEAFLSRPRFVLRMTGREFICPLTALELKGIF